MRIRALAKNSPHNVAAPELAELLEHGHHLEQVHSIAMAIEDAWTPASHGVDSSKSEQG